MRGHFSTIPLRYESVDASRSLMTDYDFTERMQAKVGLQVVLVDDETNRFWDCVSLGFYGRRGDMNLYRSLHPCKFLSCFLI